MSTESPSPAKSVAGNAGRSAASTGSEPWSDDGGLALVHDWLNQAGGAEVVLGVLHELFPEAPIFSTISDPEALDIPMDWDVRTSWMNRLPGIRTHFQTYLPVYPLAWRTTSVAGYGLVLSNKSGFCHGVRVGEAVHVCYCLTPTRFVWQAGEYVAHERVGVSARLALRAILPLLKRWDYAAAQRVDRFVAISTAVQERISTYYRRDSAVIHPPAQLSDYHIGASAGDHYVVLARLAPYKRLDLAVEAFSRLGRRLLVIGEGRDRARLENLAGPTVQFLGRLPQSEVAELLSGCRALIWPGVEDYGLAPVEAMASGRPVIARRAGGVLDTVIDGRTGLFFDRPDSGALAAAVELADDVTWEPNEIRRHARQFGREVFEERIQAFLIDAAARGKRGAYEH